MPTRPFPPVLLAAGALSLAGCGDRGLSQAWQLDRLRVLAVRADPAEPQPGETVDFEALYYLPPDQELELAVWFACLPDSADEFGCEVDSSLLDGLDDLDPESMTPEELAKLYAELAEAGLIGVDPILPPSWTAPADALDGLGDQERLEGVSAVINISAIPAQAQDDGDLELAYKRLPISEATTPNHNPDLTGFLVDGATVESGATVQASWGGQLTIEPLLSEDSIETYAYQNDDGVDEERVEEPFLAWYTEAGEFDQSYALYPATDVVWSAPASQASTDLPDDQLRIIAVIRDRRGGMDWAELTVSLATD